MTTTVNTISSNFNFRNKFEKLIQCDEEREVFVKAFEKFFNLKPENALHMLWQMTYTPSSYVLEKIGLYAGISPEMIIPIRNELRHQYKEQHPDFLNINIPEAHMDAFTNLKNKTDSIVATVVYNHCQSSLYVEEDYMSRLLFLLKSDKENNYFGGIRSLHFNMEESVYLKPFHEQIHDLLMVMYDYMLQHNHSPKNMAFEGLDKLIKDARFDLPFHMEDTSAGVVAEVSTPENADKTPVTPEVEHPVQAGCEYKSLTAEEIMTHKNAFASFVKDSDLNVLFQIGKLNFDLNEVMAKKDAISNYLKAIETKEKAEAQLLKATEALSK